MHKLAPLFLLQLSLSLVIFSSANQAEYLHRFLKLRRSQISSISESFWSQSDAAREYSPVFLAPQDGLMSTDKITALPGLPDGVDFDHYAGYVTVDPTAGRALFYYFAESPNNSSTKPLILWLNGGGCSSLGFGAMEELGPFRVNSDGKSLFRNNYAWNNVANVIFLESPTGIHFSYSNTSSDYQNRGETTTAIDAYTFLVIWLDRFPQYKTRDFYITEESYAGHYAPQLAQTILLNNKNTTQTLINIKGIVGTRWWTMDDATVWRGIYDHRWTHALNSNETHRGILKYCEFPSNKISVPCIIYEAMSDAEMGNIDNNNMYSPICRNPVLKNGSRGSVSFFDPCSDTYVGHYLSTAEVQNALHVKPTTWTKCSHLLKNWTDWQSNVLPTIESLMASGMRVWLYSVDIDENVPVTATRYAISSLKLPIETSWRPWYLDTEVGGYLELYKGLTFVTVRGSGHIVPSYQPHRALTMISSFLLGILPPSS